MAAKASLCCPCAGPLRRSHPRPSLVLLSYAHLCITLSFISCTRTKASPCSTVTRVRAGHLPMSAVLSRQLTLCSTDVAQVRRGHGLVSERHPGWRQMELMPAKARCDARLQVQLQEDQPKGHPRGGCAESMPNDCRSRGAHGLTTSGQSVVSRRFIA